MTRSLGAIVVGSGPSGWLEKNLIAHVMHSNVLRLPYKLQSARTCAASVKIKNYDRFL